MDLRLTLLCDRCDAQAAPGAGAFAAWGDLLDFAPVPRRKRVGGWTPDVQRAFIAALAVTGSVRQSAAAVGRREHGIKQLREARGADSFNAAFDRAVARARRREQGRMAANVLALARGAAGIAVEAEDPPGEPALPITQADRDRLHAISFRRALEGDAVPVFHAGVQVGTRRVYNDRLALYHLGGGATGQPAASGDRAASQTLSGRELRIHRMLVENPNWTRAFADKLLTHGDSIIRAFPRPWRFGKEDDLIQEIGFFRQAFRDTLAADPARAAAFETLFGAEGDRLDDFHDCLRHAAIIFETMLGEFMPMVEEMRAILWQKVADHHKAAVRDARAQGLPPPTREETLAKLAEPKT